MELVLGNDVNSKNVKKMYNDYKSAYCFENEKPDFVLKISNDMQKDIKFFASNEEVVFRFKHRSTNSNGLVISPWSKFEHFTILINERVFLDDQYVHTVFHEFTHLFDIYFYLRDYGSRENNCNNKYYWEFHYWTEFHAKSVGSRIYFSYLEQNNKGGEPGFHSQDLIGKINGFTTGLIPFQIVFSELMSYWGRLSVFNVDKDLHPNLDFTEALLIETFGSGITELYDLLLGLKDYKLAKDKLARFEVILKTILTFVNDKDLIPKST